MSGVGAGVASSAFRGVTGSLAAILSGTFIAAALVPVAWALCGLDWADHIVTVSSATAVVALVQIAVCLAIAARFDRRLKARMEGASTDRLPEANAFAGSLALGGLVTAILIGPGALFATGCLSGRCSLSSLAWYAVVFAVTQMIFALAVRRVGRARARIVLLDVGELPVDALSSASSSATSVIFRGLILCTATAALCMGLCAHRLIRSETYVDTVANYRQLVEGILASSSIPAGDEVTASVLVNSLTRFNESEPFVMDSVGVWRNRFGGEDAVRIANASGRSNSGFSVDEWSGEGAIWTTLVAGEEKVGVKLLEISGPGMPYVIIALLFAAAFGSAILSMRVGGWMRRVYGQRVEAIENIPDGPVMGEFSVMTAELALFDRQLVLCRSKYLSARTSHDGGLDTGAKQREERAKMFTSMSHDLRSPLNSVIGFTDLLLKGLDGKLNTRQRRTVSRVAQESERLLVLISDILDTAKLDSGSFDLDRAWIPSVEILTECESGARRLVATREVQFTSHLEPGLPPVRVDKERIVRALLSLLARVIDSMEKGTVKLGAARTRGLGETTAKLAVEIADLGVDMDPTHRRRIEEALGAAERSSPREHDGEVGLGLNLASRILSLHGGVVEVDEHPGGGLILRASIPLEDPSALN